MAEAVAARGLAAKGLAASVIELVDLNAKIAGRKKDFEGPPTAVASGFRTLARRLPMTMHDLQRVQAQVDAGDVSINDTLDLKTHVDNVNAQIALLEELFQELTPTADPSRVERGFKILQTSTQDERMAQTIEDINHEHMNLAFRLAAVERDTANCQEQFSLKLEESSSQHQELGLWLDRAPQVDPDAFLGRSVELQQLDDWLSPKGDSTHAQKVVSVMGMGACGKTQLSLAYVRQYGGQYSSVIWLDAQDELSLQQSLVRLSRSISIVDESYVDITPNEGLRILRVQKWLSAAWNNRWLIVFDNYDDPALPDKQSSTSFSIQTFFPSCAQGSILITTRSPEVMFDRRIMLDRLDNIALEMAILSQQAGRDVSHESDSRQLARRLGGIPLALAAAGSCIRQAGISCADYLNMYEQSWSKLRGPTSDTLIEHVDRTLSSAWIISLNYISQQDADAAELLKFFALLNNQDIWYELIQAGAPEGPPWMSRITATKLQFDTAMLKLRDYSLVEVTLTSYRVHHCVHDWLLGQFHLSSSDLSFSAAVNCVFQDLPESESSQYWIVSRRLMSHVQRFEHKQFKPLWKAYLFKEATLGASLRFAQLYEDLQQRREAEQIYTRALAGYEDVLGTDHASTLSVVVRLGRIYHEQDRQAEADCMFQRATAGYEKILWADDITTLEFAIDLGSSYFWADRVQEVLPLYERILAGRDEERNLLEPESIALATLLDNFGMYHNHVTGLAEAVQMYQRALAVSESVLGADHNKTLRTMYALGDLYFNQQKFVEAEQMLLRALAGYENAPWPERVEMPMVAQTIGDIYFTQGKLVEAEQMYQRALIGYEETQGLNLWSSSSEVTWSLNQLLNSQAWKDGPGRQL